MMSSASYDAGDGSRQSATMQTERQEENRVSNAEQTQATATPRVSQSMDTPSAAANLQIHGNVTNSQIRQNNNQALQIPPAFKAAAKEPQGTQRPIVVTGGSVQRKRSRVIEEGGQGATQSVTKIHEHVNIMNAYIESLQKNGKRGNTGLVRVQMSESIKEIMAEATNLLAKMVNIQDLQISYLKAEKQMKDKLRNLQEENNSVKQQVIELQLKLLQKEQEEKGVTPMTYAQIATKQIAANIITGKQLPLPQIAQSVNHAPPECIIIFKAVEKGEMMSKQEQEKFRKEMKEVLNEEEMQGISVIRPTRYGGHTLIFHNEKNRNKMYEKLRSIEKAKGVEEMESMMIAPMKRVAKVVCKEVPDDISIEQVKRDMFGKHNPALHTVNNAYRTGKIYRTRLGMIFELSGHEMAAIQSQGWRIRCDLARELKVEEFISIQQCYACSKFGHNASECKAGQEMCRLCGKSEYIGKDCPDKNNKEA